MPAPRIAKAMPQHDRRKRPDMSPDHKALVRRLPCLGCGTEPVEGGNFTIDPHHLMHPDHGQNSRGMGRTSADKWVVPMCRGFGVPNCHDAAQSPKVGDDEAWLAGRGIDGRAVARALWAATGDLEAMRRIIFRARQDAAMKGYAHV